MGSWVRPTPVTSTLNWAKAGKAGAAANAAIKRRRVGCRMPADGKCVKIRSVIIDVLEWPSNRCKAGCHVTHQRKTPCDNLCLP